MCFEVADHAASFQFPAQQFRKNLEMTWTVDESCAGLGNHGQLNGHRVSVTDRWTLKPRRTFNAIGLAEQMANGDLRFARIILPLSDRVRHRIVESKQAVLHSRERSDSPKSFCSAEDRPSSIRRAAIRVMLENGPAVLDYHHRTAAPALRIFCGTRAIGGLDFGW